MLSRVADNLYWMSRYLERAEHTARLLGVTINQMLDQTPDGADKRWERLLRGLRVARQPKHDPYAITCMLTLSTENKASILSCIAAARENARQVREMISSEMWEQLNRLYLQVRTTTMADLWNNETIAFFQAVKEGSHLFQGITDATMSHGEGWHFIQLGRFLERAQTTAPLLDVYFNDFPIAPPADHAEYLEWVSLLKSCTAFEAYCKVYTAEIKPACVAEFLLLNAELPRSVRFAADTIQLSLHAIGRITGRSAGRADRLAGRLRASLDYTQVDEILADNLHSYLAGIQHQAQDIHAAIYQTYVDYPVATVIGP